MLDIIPSILSVVSLLCSCRGHNRYYYLSDLHENKDALNTAMEELKDRRDDVKRRVDEAENDPYEPRKRTSEVDRWLLRVQIIEGEVCDILEKADQEIEGRCLGGYCSKNFWKARKIGKLVIKKLSIVNDLRSKGSFRNVAYKLSPPLVLEEPVDLPVGLEPLFQKVLKSIVEDDPVRIMGLYGNGGVGKTTLLKQINNEFLKNTTTTTHGFDVVILVVVSKEVNIDAIRKVIGDRLGLSSPDTRGVPPPTTDRRSIFNALTKKNFVLLLDDIWERVDLQSIGIPRLENNKSKVIFTTRFENVCGDMDANTKFRVECLPWIEAWTLFQRKVGNETLNFHPEVPKLAKLVAKECGGLPLALITLGRAMSTKKSLQEWKHAVATLQRSASKFPGMGDKVLPLLKLSYDDLQNETIKSCFLYCAIYPEDWSIDRAKLIDHWIGEGLILLDEFNHIDEARNQGYDVIGILKGACLLESGVDGKTQVKMHDVIRDLALWIACECGGSKKDNNYMLTIEMSDLRLERWYNAERIWLRDQVRGKLVEKYVSPPKSPNLLTLIYDHGVSMPNSFFQFMPHLRVLDLSHCDMYSFPISITRLLELQYLSLSWTCIKELPKELGKLVKLNFLDLSHMMYLEKIPSGVIGSLLDLRVLNLFDSYQVNWDIEELYKLKHLNDLGISINTQPSLNKLLSLSYPNLQRCTRHLQLRMYITVPSFPVCITDSMFSPSPTACIQDPVPGSPSMCITKLSPISDISDISISRFSTAYIPDISISGFISRLSTACIPDIPIPDMPIRKDRTRNGRILDRREILDIPARRRTKYKSLESSPMGTRCSSFLPMDITDSSPVCIVDSSVFSSSLPSSSSTTTTLQVNHTAVKSLENLELLSNLERLVIQTLGMNMEWENHHEAQQHLRSFQNLSEITISECYVKDLTWVVYVVNLRKLDVEDCEGIEEIVVGDKISGMMSVDIFKSLETLKMTRLQTLKSICNQALVFPSLVSMYIFKCPQLKKLPLDSNSNVNNTLQIIEGQRKWWSELQWEDHDNVKSKFLPYIEHRHFND